MQPVHRVEFIGGPFDGHVQRVSLNLEDMAEVALLPVSRAIYGWLHGQAKPPRARVTSMAEYHLELAGSECRYRFKRSLAPAESSIGG